MQSYKFNYLVSLKNSRSWRDLNPPLTKSYLKQMTYQCASVLLLVERYTILYNLNFSTEMWLQMFYHSILTILPFTIKNCKIILYRVAKLTRSLEALFFWVQCWKMREIGQTWGMQWKGIFRGSRKYGPFFMWWRFDFELWFSAIWPS